MGLGYHLATTFSLHTYLSPVVRKASLSSALDFCTRTSTTRTGGRRLMFLCMSTITYTTYVVYISTCLTTRRRILLPSLRLPSPPPPTHTFPFVSGMRATCHARQEAIPLCHAQEGGVQQQTQRSNQIAVERTEAAVAANTAGVQSQVHERGVQSERIAVAKEYSLSQHTASTNKFIMQVSTTNLCWAHEALARRTCEAPLQALELDRKISASLSTQLQQMKEERIGFHNSGAHSIDSGKP